MSDLSVTLIQSSLHWEDTDANLKMFDEKIDSIKEKTEIVMLPEMFSTGFSMHPEILAETMDGKTIQWMRATASKKKIILTGSIIIEENGQYFNRLIWMLPNGQFAFYDKRHLFAYAEEHQHYTAGNKKLMAQVKGWKIYPVICYDLRFPVWLRQPPEEEERYDLLICVANWPASRSDAWDVLLCSRAIENQCFVAGINRSSTDGNHIYYNGGSAIVDPEGKVIIRKDKDESMIQYTLQKDTITDTRKRFPFLQDADHFTIQLKSWTK